MPLIIAIGNPSTERTKVSEFLKEKFSIKGRNVVLISDENYFESFGRDIVDNDPCEKKLLHVYLISEVERHLTPDNLVILDAVNDSETFVKKLVHLSKEKETTYCSIECVSVETNSGRKAFNINSPFGKASDLKNAIFFYWGPYTLVYNNKEDVFEKLHQYFYKKSNIEFKKSISTNELAKNNLEDLLTKTETSSIGRITQCLQSGQFKNITIAKTKREISFKNLITTDQLKSLFKEFRFFIYDNPVPIETMEDALVNFFNSSN